MNSRIMPVEPRRLSSVEDRNRAADRSRVLEARHGGRKGLLIWLLLGPGVLVMLGENDGPSMLSYAATGASYGIGFFLPFIVLTFAAAYFVQEMGMRLGAVTHRGYGELLFQRFGPFWGWFTLSDLVITNLITLISEIIAMVAPVTSPVNPPRPCSLPSASSARSPSAAANTNAPSSVCCAPAPTSVVPPAMPT